MQLKIAKQVCFLIATIFLLIFIVFNSCKKVHDKNPVQVPGVPVDTVKKDTFYIPPQLLEKVTSSISGFVTGDFDADGKGIEGASITFGNKTAITDESGYFEIKDASVSKLAAQVSASKANYLTSFKTFITSEGESNFERLRLVNTINRNYNSSISYSGSFVIEGTNTGYSGYQFYSGYEMWKDDEISMPGDSRGIDSAHHIKLLNSYGICAFYSLTNNAVKLQIVQPAIIKMKAVGISFTPPATIPVWYYDEKIGLWRQVGTATYDGQSYETSINQLGIYNFAIPSDDYNIVSARLITANGEPIPYTAITINKQTDAISTSNFRYTDANGFIKVAAPVNSSLSFNVHSDGFPEPTFSKKFNNPQNDFSLESITINTQDNLTINGTLLSCNGSKITNGFIELNDKYRFFPDANGHFHFNTLNKYIGEYTIGILTAEENSTKQKSDLLYLNIPPGAIIDTTISVCSHNGNVNLTATLVDNTGQPLPNLFYTMSPASFPSNIYKGTTDSFGNINVSIYQNTTNVLSVYGSSNCGNVIFTKSFNTVNTNVDLGKLIVPVVFNGNVTGTVVDCNNNPVKSGNVIIQKDQINFQSPINADGTFNFSIPICNTTDPEPATIIAENGETLSIGNAVKISLKEGNDNLGNISACLNNSDTLQYMNYSVDSTFYSLVAPIDNFDDIVLEGTHWSVISGVSANQKWGLYFVITGNIAVGASGISLDEFVVTPGYAYNGNGSITVNITEYGPIGGYIAGNIKVKVEKTDDHSIHNADCSFRVKRKE